jgi:multiple sugar transport system substrate-binding protein
MKDRSIMLPVEKAQIGGDGFAAGVAAMTFADHRVIPAYTKLPFDWGVAPFPKGEKERVTLMETSGIVASANTPHPTEAWKFIQFVISPEGQTMLASRGTALPVSAAVVNSEADRSQPHAADQKIFIEAMSYAKLKPSFKGYAQWASLVNDPLSLVWSGEASLDEALGEIAASADEALAP